MAKAWMPTEEVKAWLRATYSYDPVTGVVSRGGSPVGAHLENNGYMRVRIRNAKLGVNTLASIHRLAWFLLSGEFTSGDVDHINMDRADNRACNLRAATRSQNMANTRKVRTTRLGGAPSSKYKGVSYNNRDFCWMAEVRVNGEQIRLGRFDDELDAAAAYDAAALQHFGEHARVNLSAPRAA